jgi:hypothetical protein
LLKSSFIFPSKRKKPAVAAAGFLVNLVSESLPGNPSRRGTAVMVVVMMPGD